MTYSIKIITIKSDNPKVDQAETTLNELAKEGYEVKALYGNGSKLHVIMQRLEAS